MLKELMAMLKKKTSQNTITINGTRITGNVVNGNIVGGDLHISGGSFNSSDLKKLGPAITQSRETKPFNKIHINAVFDVEFVQSEKYSLTVIAQESLLPKILTVVEGDTLIIKINGDYIATTKTVIKITAPSLVALKQRSVSNFTGTGITAEHFELSFDSTGNCKIEGSSKSAKLSIKGVGSVNLKKLIIDNIVIDTNNVGNIQLRANETITGSIKGVGNTDIYGNPRNAGLKSKSICSVNFH